jgi:hypothetical protein
LVQLKDTAIDLSNISTEEEIIQYFQNGFTLGMLCGSAKEVEILIEKEIFENGEYIPTFDDGVIGYKGVLVNVQRSGLPGEVNSETVVCEEVPELSGVEATSKYIFPTASVKIGGTPNIGSTVTADLLNINKYAALNYQWRKGMPIQFLNNKVA